MLKTVYVSSFVKKLYKLLTASLLQKVLQVGKTKILCYLM